MVFLEILDECLITVEHGIITPHAHSLFALGLYLIIERGKRIPRDLLATLLWPHIATKTARRCLRRALWKLRSLGFPIHGDYQSYIILPKNAASIDVDTLANTEPSALSHRDYRVLPWYNPHSSAQFRDWVDEVRHLTIIRVVTQLQGILQRENDSANWPLVVQLAERILVLDAMNSEVQATLTHARTMLQPVSSAPSRSIRFLPSSSYNPSHNYVKRNYALRVAEPNRQSVYTTKDHQDAPNGQNSEMAPFTHAVEETIHRSGNSLYIWGQAGTGKTHLLTEIQRHAHAQGAIVYQITLHPADVDSPWSVFTSIIPLLQEAPGAAGRQPELDQYLTRLAQGNPPILPNSSEPHAATPLFNNTQLALLDLLEAVADEQPVVLLIDNVQWIDSCSQSVLAYMGDWTRTRAVLLVCTSSQPDTHQAFPGFTTHQLPAISPAGVVAPTALSTLPQAALSPEQAIQLGTRQIDLAIEQGHMGDVIAMCEQALPNCTTNQTRFSVFSSYATALHGIRNYEKALPILAATRSLKPALTPFASPHDEFELLAFDAILHTGPHWSQIAQACTRCLTIADATPTHRVDAATLICQISAEMGSVQIIRQTYQTIQPFLEHNDTSELSRSRFEAAYHALTGDPAVATATIHRILMLIRETHKGTRLLSDLIYCANCLQWSGMIDAAIAVFVEVITIATREKWYPYAIQAAQQLMIAFLNRGNITAAQAWADQLDTIEPPTSQFLTQRYKLLQLRLALARQKTIFARELFDKHRESLLNDSRCSIRATAYAAKIRLIIQEKTDTNLVASAVATLSSLCEQLRGLRMQDYEYFSMYLGFSYIGKSDRAKQCLEDYLTQFRNDVTPPTQELKTAAHQEALACASAL